MAMSLRFLCGRVGIVQKRHERYLEKWSVENCRKHGVANAASNSTNTNALTAIVNAKDISAAAAAAVATSTAVAASVANATTIVAHFADATTAAASTTIVTVTAIATATINAFVVAIVFANAVVVVVAIVILQVLFLQTQIKIV